MRRLTTAIVGGLLAAAPSAAVANSTGGGAYQSPAASIASVQCRMDCVDRRTAKPGSLVRLKGRAMKRVKLVTFVGAPGRRDDVTVPAEQSTPRSVVVRVPVNAVSGRVRVRNADGALSRPSRAPLLVGGEPVAEEAEPPADKVADRDTTDTLDAHVDTNTVFFEGFRKATFRYVVTAPSPVEVAVELVRLGDGAAIQRWTPGSVAPGTEQQVEWDGTAGGAVVPEGRYEFRVFATAAAAAAEGGEPPLVADSFRFLDHKFPVRGKHDYAEEMARFGSGRSGPSHQGHAVFAVCGTPLVAARGGQVERKKFH